MHPIDPLYKNWFPVQVPIQHFLPAKNLNDEVIEWLKANCKTGWKEHLGYEMVAMNRHMVGGDTYCEVSSPTCEVYFRSKRDATLFRLFWG